MVQDPDSVRDPEGGCLSPGHSNPCFLVRKCASVMPLQAHSLTAGPACVPPSTALPEGAGTSGCRDHSGECPRARGLHRAQAPPRLHHVVKRYQQVWCRDRCTVTADPGCGPCLSVTEGTVLTHGLRDPGVALSFFSRTLHL